MSSNGCNGAQVGVSELRKETRQKPHKHTKNNGMHGFLIITYMQKCNDKWNKMMEKKKQKQKNI